MGEIVVDHRERWLSIDLGKGPEGVELELHERFDGPHAPANLDFVIDGIIGLVRNTAQGALNKDQDLTGLWLLTPSARVLDPQALAQFITTPIDDGQTVEISIEAIIRRQKLYRDRLPEVTQIPTASGFATQLSLMPVVMVDGKETVAVTSTVWWYRPDAGQMYQLSCTTLDLPVGRELNGLLAELAAGFHGL